MANPRPTAAEERRFQHLRQWRLEMAGGRPAYTVMPDSTLRAIARQRPTTKAGMLAIHGIGAHRWATYGPQLLWWLAADRRRPLAPEARPGGTAEPRARRLRLIPDPRSFVVPGADRARFTYDGLADQAARGLADQATALAACTDGDGTGVAPPADASPTRRARPLTVVARHAAHQRRLARERAASVRFLAPDADLEWRPAAGGATAGRPSPPPTARPAEALALEESKAGAGPDAGSPPPRPVGAGAPAPGPATATADPDCPLDCPTCAGSWWRPDGTCLICDRDDDPATAHDSVLRAHWDELFHCAHGNCTNEAVDPDNGRPLCHVHADLAIDPSVTDGDDSAGDAGVIDCTGSPPPSNETARSASPAEAAAARRRYVATQRSQKCAHPRCNKWAADALYHRPLCLGCEGDSGDGEACGFCPTAQPALVVVVEGNIASGKTTLLDELAKMGWTVHREGLSDWADLLGLFYSQPRRWAFTLQAAILADMHHQHAARTAHGSRSGWIFVERSPTSSALFARNSADLGHMTPREMRLLTSLQVRLGWVADVTVYVDTGPATCLLRMQGRGRDAEGQVTPAYLRRIDALHRHAFGDGRRVEGSLAPADAARAVLDHARQHVRDAPGTADARSRAASATAAPAPPLWEWPPLGMRASSGRRRGTCHHRHCLRECAGGGYRPADQLLCRPCLDGVYATACPGPSWPTAAPGSPDGADCADCSHAATPTL